MSKDEKAKEIDDDDECCAICLQMVELPICFPCSHKFCFLCAKGACMRDKRCSLCRSRVPDDFFTNPSTSAALPSTPSVDDDETCWFYEGFNGWWRFDDRNGAELEKAFVAGRNSLELLLAGNIYVVNFDRMLQYRKNDSSKRRRVKREVVKVVQAVKGVAGIKLNVACQASIKSQTSDRQLEADESEQVADQLNALHLHGSSSEEDDTLQQHT